MRSAKYRDDYEVLKDVRERWLISEHDVQILGQTSLLDSFGVSWRVFPDTQFLNVIKLCQNKSYVLKISGTF